MLDPPPFSKTQSPHIIWNWRVFAWNNFKTHATENVRKLLKQKKTDHASIPGGCTKYVQAPNVVWKKPFESHIMHEWLASGVHQYTEVGNMKPNFGSNFGPPKYSSKALPLLC